MNEMPPSALTARASSSPSSSKKIKTRAAFGVASNKNGKKFFEKLPLKWVVALVVVVGGIAGYLWVDWMFIPPKGNNLYGICRSYIEQRLIFPTTLKIIQMNEQIPSTEDKKNPQRIEYQILFANRDSYGEHRLDSVTCGFRFRSDLVNTPWQGIELERVLFNGRSNHGWADVNRLPDKKDPRDPADRSEDLENFQSQIPSLLQNPPDLTLPMRDLYRMDIKDLRDL